MNSASQPRTPVTNVRNERLWEAECAGKDPYPSEAAAQAALAHIKKTGRGRNLCWLESYQCKSCQNWHLGNV